MEESEECDDCGCPKYAANSLEDCDQDQGGGRGGEPQVLEVPTTPDPCGQAAQAAGTNATNLYNETAVEAALGNIPHMQIPPPGFPPNNESFFYISNSNGSVVISPIETVDPTGGSPSRPPTVDDIGELHTHPILVIHPRHKISTDLEVIHLQTVTLYLCPQRRGQYMR